MPRQANGNYIAPANTAAVTSTPISSTAFNTLESDIGTEITNSLDRLGRSAMQASLPMGTNKITGMADPAVATDGATKNYVDTTTAAFFSTGDVKFTLKTAADTGWILFDDGTFGSATSGSSSRANADTQTLFTLLFNNVSDANCAIFTSGGGATTRAAQTNAAAAWAANCRMSLPKVLGRAMSVAGVGAGLTGRALANSFGEEAHTLVVGELPGGITSSNASQAITVAESLGRNIPATAGTIGQLGIVTSGATAVPTSNITWGTATSFTGTNNISVTSNNTLGGSHNNIGPRVYLNCMVKL